MTTVTLKAVVAALRDTAAKTEEKVETKRDVDRFSPHYHGTQEFTTDIHDRFDRHWIAGRLLGMADMIEAMCPELKEEER